MNKYLINAHPLHYFDAAIQAFGEIAFEYPFKSNLELTFQRNFSVTALKALRLHLPYCWDSIPNRPGELILLNREYKPLGLGTIDNSHYDYSAFPDRIIAISQIAECLPFLHKLTNSDTTTYMFYNDITAPWGTVGNTRKSTHRLFNLYRLHHAIFYNQWTNTNGADYLATYFIDSLKGEVE
jgi:hypothetical protein